MLTQMIKKIILISIYLLSFFIAQSQESYFTIAPSGLIIRSEPNINSKRIGKLPYGSTVKLLEKTGMKLQITDDGKTIDGEWVKVKFDNNLFVVSETEEYKSEGYVFNRFLEKLIKATIEYKEIDSLGFYSFYREPQPSNIIKITSKEELRKLLGSRIKWQNTEDDGWEVKGIVLENGQVRKVNDEFIDYFFMAYFPTEEILLFEGGHGSDFSISIKTGETFETIGNPEYIIESPNKKLRLNGWFPGQECSSYFFQKKTESNYTYLIDFGFGTEGPSEDVCNFKKFCWLNDQEFMYSYGGNYGETGGEKYFIARIKKQ